MAREFQVAIHCTEDDIQNIWRDLELIVGKIWLEHYRADAKTIIREFQRGSNAESELYFTFAEHRQAGFLVFS